MCKFMFVVVVVLICAIGVGCGSDDSVSHLPPNWDITGTWDLYFFGATYTGSGVMDVVQTDGQLTGSMTNDAFMVFDVIGYVSGDMVCVTFMQSGTTGYVVYADVTTTDGVNANGTWDDNAGQYGNCDAVKR